MNIHKADHAALLVEKVERSLQFYTQVLGMQEIPRPQNFDFPGAWVTSSGFQIHLIGEDTEGRARQVHPGYQADELTRGYGTHLAFEVDDLAETIRHLNDRDIRIVGGPRPRGDGVQQLYICDPDGYMIELFVWES